MSVLATIDPDVFRFHRDILIVTYAFSASARVRVGGRGPTSRGSGRKLVLPRHRRNAGAVFRIERRGDQSVGEQPDQEYGVHGTGHARHEHLHEQRGTDVRRIFSFRHFFYGKPTQ